MRLITYQDKDTPALGVMHEERIVNLSAAYLQVSNKPFPKTMTQLLEEGQEGLEKVQQVLEYAATREVETQAINDVRLLPPVLKPTKVIALGRNYAAHAKEGGAEPPAYPMLFHKTATSLLGAGGNIVIPPISDKIDYEAELAVVIGQTCKNVSEEDALDFVAGYTVANDVTARDWQRRTSQFTSGKMLDTFGPLGPALVTKDEVSDVGNLQIQSRLNGATMQKGNTKDMIFSVPFLISYISQISTLEVGDVILTGTPEGVGYARKPPVFMKAGDVIEIEVEGLGILRNNLIATS